MFRTIIVVVYLTLAIFLILPFLILLLIVLGIITYVPFLTLWLPNLVFG